MSMPRMMGRGLRKRVASTMASNIVLSPISASATTAVEVRTASMEIISGPGFKTATTLDPPPGRTKVRCHWSCPDGKPSRSEEHTSELQSLMRISYAVFCLKKKNDTTHNQYRKQSQNSHRRHYD